MAVAFAKYRVLQEKYLPDVDPLISHPRPDILIAAIKERDPNIGLLEIIALDDVRASLSAIRLDPPRHGVTQAEFDRLVELTKRFGNYAAVSETITTLMGDDPRSDEEKQKARELRDYAYRLIGNETLIIIQKAIAHLKKTLDPEIAADYEEAKALDEQLIVAHWLIAIDPNSEVKRIMEQA